MGAEKKIEVTPEMLEAGLGAFYTDRRFNLDEEIVCSIFREMMAVATKSIYPESFPPDERPR